jgi:hypothetical protein
VSSLKAPLDRLLLGYCSCCLTFDASCTPTMGSDSSLTCCLEPIDGHPYISPNHIIQRPKVVHSKGTGKYHVSLHVPTIV